MPYGVHRLRGMLLCLLAVGASVQAGLTSPARASDLRRTPIVRAVERARPSIVNIHGEKSVGPESEGRRVNGMGTGVIIDERGYVITNFHVVEGVKEINVTLADRTSYRAELVSHDAATDLAIIRIPATEELPVIDIGTSSDLMPGESVIAVGNAYGYEHTVTWGIISALHRAVQVSETQSYDDLVQTDASINPGNSGGPLLNIDGEMIGINVAVRAGAQGIGFAIPIDKAMQIAADLLSSQRLSETWHGIEGASPDGEKPTILTVAAVEEESPAAECGLQPGDLIVQAGDRATAWTLDLERACLGRSVGDAVPLVVRRAGQEMRLDLVLARSPNTAKPIDDAWDVLGLRMETVPKAQFKSFRTRFRGGLRVTEVRDGSPAADQGIRAGDILVGMHIWQTVTAENVRYILNRPDFTQLEPLKFYILRGNETLYGHMTVAHRTATR